MNLIDGDHDEGASYPDVCLDDLEVCLGNENGGILEDRGHCSSNDETQGGLDHRMS